jgi:hypothetical protein
VKEIKRHYEFMKQEALKEMRYSASASRSLAKKVKSGAVGRNTKTRTVAASPNREDGNP